MNKIVSGIYAIRNKKNGKMYIGSAVHLGSRWVHHRSHLNLGNHHNIHLQNSWNKNGEEFFEFLILELVEDKNYLISKEQEYVNSIRPEYNISPTAGSALGMKLSESARNKISLSKIGKPRSKEMVSKMIASKKRSPMIHTDEWKKSHSEKLKGHIVSDETRKKISIANTGNKSRTGMKTSEETKRKIGEAAKERARKKKILGELQ